MALIWSLSRLPLAAKHWRSHSPFSQSRLVSPGREALPWWAQTVLWGSSHCARLKACGSGIGQVHLPLQCSGAGDKWWEMLCELTSALGKVNRSLCKGRWMFTAACSVCGSVLSNWWFGDIIEGAHLGLFQDAFGSLLVISQHQLNSPGSTLGHPFSLNSSLFKIFHCSGCHLLPLFGLYRRVVESWCPHCL